MKINILERCAAIMLCMVIVISASKTVLAVSPEESMAETQTDNSDEGMALTEEMEQPAEEVIDEALEQPIEKESTKASEGEEEIAGETEKVLESEAAQ